MPLRSTGCHKCRQRKIRCDEQRPACLKCATHGVVCPGYKTDRPGDVEFRDQTSQTVQRSTVNGSGRRSVQRKASEFRQHHWNLSNTTTAASKLNGVQLQQSKSRQLTVPAFDSPPRNGLSRMALHEISSPAVNRMRLYDTFMQLYVPRNSPSQERGLFTSNAEFISTLVTLPSCQPSLSHALDALSLVQVGSVKNDKYVINKAIEAYTKALRALALAISKPENLQDDTTLATACILSTCEFYRDFRLQGLSWVSHQQGMQRLIEARGPASVMNSRLALHLFYQATSSSLAMSLLLRKQDPYTADKWRDVVQKELEMNDDQTGSYRFGLHLPTLLERHDTLLSSMHKPTCELVLQLDELLMACQAMEIAMKDHLASHLSRAAVHEQAWIMIADVDDFHPYAKLVLDRTLRRAFRFPSFHAAYEHSSHWLLMYMLRQTIQSLHFKRMTLVPGWQPASHNIVEDRELLCYILNLVRLVPYFTETASGATGEMCCFFPLFVAEQYFCAHQHWRWARWVQEVSTSIFQKGMSTPFAGMCGELPSPGPSYDQADVELGFNWIESPAAPVLQHADQSLSPSGQTIWTVRSASSNSTRSSNSRDGHRSPLSNGR